MKIVTGFFLLLTLMAVDPFGAATFLFGGIRWILDPPDTPILAGLTEAIPLMVSLARQMADRAFSTRLSLELPSLVAPLEA